MAETEGTERRKVVLSNADFEVLKEKLAEWLLEDKRYLDQLSNRVKEALWEDWYLELGKITLRASGYLAWAAFVALAGWLAFYGKLIP